MNDIEQIKKQIEELETFKAQIEKEQLKFPVDRQSMDLISDKAIIIPSAEKITVTSLNLAGPFEEATEVKTLKKKYWLETSEHISFLAP